MLSKVPDKSSLWIFSGFGMILISCILFGFSTGFYYIFILPPALIGAYIVYADIKLMFYILLACIPLSTELFLPNGLATDVPTEPIMILLMMVYIFYAATNPKMISRKFLNHPLILLLLLHFIWIAVAAIFSAKPVISFKFLLAKTWYLVVFVFLTDLVLREIRDLKKAMWLIFVPLCFVIIQTLLRHWQVGFHFDKVNQVVTPFFRNHVNYAAMISIMLPFVWFMRKWYKKGAWQRNALWLVTILFLFGIGFSYTRGAWLSVFAAGMFYLFIKFRTVRYVIPSGMLVIILFLGFMIRNNQYLEYSTDYKKTIYYDTLGDHLQATMQRLDVSSAERVYRWIAGFRMSTDEWITGFGPGNFYNFYKSYTVNIFTTWVSDNQEKSGVHNYFLMTLIEQGIIGLILFVSLYIAFLVMGERIYHNTRDPAEKYMVMAVLLSNIAILVQIMLSDLIEVDKVGAIFFINIALLVRQDIKNKQHLAV
ncbi:MAG: O-antigen ligase family protein [Bacteroidetes bacterium]|nr:O-antigen ligase family protein [Bacteroidota bacterium]